MDSTRLWWWCCYSLVIWAYIVLLCSVVSWSQKALQGVLNTFWKLGAAGAIDILDPRSLFLLLLLLLFSLNNEAIKLPARRASAFSLSPSLSRYGKTNETRGGRVNLPLSLMMNALTGKKLLLLLLFIIISCLNCILFIVQRASSSSSSFLFYGRCCCCDPNSHQKRIIIYGHCGIMRHSIRPFFFLKAIEIKI